MILADTSRAYLKQVGTEIDKDDLDAQVHLVSSMVETSGVALARMKKLSSEHEILSELTRNILHGWPIKKTQLNDRFKQYWSYRDELSVINGMIFKGERIIVPTGMQSEMLRNLHISHMGIEKTKLRARESMFWPGTNQQIEDMVKSCNICITNQRKQSKEPMQASDIAVYPFQKIGTDLFH